MALFYDILITLGIFMTACPAIILLYHSHKSEESWEYKNRKKTIVVATLLLIGTSLISYGTFIEPKLLVTTYQTIDLKSVNNPIKIVLISDLHVGDYNQIADVKKIANRILDLNPDLVLIAGDHVLADYKTDNRLEFLSPLKDVAKKIPTIAIPGNHEYGVGDKEDNLQKRYKLPNRSADVETTMKNLGIKYFKNYTEKITINGQSFLLFGADDYLIEAINFDSLDVAQSQYPELSTIMLVHNPASAFMASEHKVDLLLAGHTHGGQVRLPFIGPAKHIESDIPESWYQGLSKYKNTLIYVTSGANESSARARLFNPPEVVLLTIN